MVKICTLNIYIQVVRRVYYSLYLILMWFQC